MDTKEEAVPPQHLQWLSANGHDLASLTGSSSKALAAIDACWTLCAYTGDSSVIGAVALLLRSMQPHNRGLARELIARAMDWGDRDRLWPLVEHFVDGKPALKVVPRG